MGYVLNQAAEGDAEGSGQSDSRPASGTGPNTQFRRIRSSTFLKASDRVVVPPTGLVKSRKGTGQKIRGKNWKMVHHLGTCDVGSRGSPALPSRRHRLIKSSRPGLLRPKRFLFTAIEVILIGFGCFWGCLRATTSYITSITVIWTLLK